MRASYAVDVRHLRKTYVKRRKSENKSGWAGWRSALRRTSAEQAEQFVAVKDVSFTIRHGEIFGLLGPNGAGKTTTIRMLSTLLEPTSGTALLNGYDVSKEPAAVRRSLGAVLTGERSIYWKLTGRENLEYFAALYHLPKGVAMQRIAEILDQLGLTAKADEYVERYSSGMKQRIAIAKALLANPAVVLLDEPTVGLDPHSARSLRELIVDIKRDGRTVLLSTHYMEEADLLCDRIAIIDAGKIIALDTPTNLKRSIAQTDLIQLELEEADEQLLDRLRGLPDVDQLASAYDDALRLWSITLHSRDSHSVLPKALAVLGQAAQGIRHVGIKIPTLEDVFISLTGKQLQS